MASYSKAALGCGAQRKQKDTKMSFYGPNLKLVAGKRWKRDQNEQRGGREELG